MKKAGRYVLGSSLEADLNATYNDGKHFPFKSLHGKKAGDTIPQLEDAVKRLGTEQHRNYWEPTAGSTGYACNILLQWAKQHPECVWEVKQKVGGGRV